MCVKLSLHRQVSVKKYSTLKPFPTSRPCAKLLRFEEYAVSLSWKEYVIKPRTNSTSYVSSRKVQTILLLSEQRPGYCLICVKAFNMFRV